MAQPDFPEALNNLGIFFGRQGDLDRAQTYFQQAVDKRADYGEAANNLALVLAARGRRRQGLGRIAEAVGRQPGVRNGLRDDVPDLSEDRTSAGGCAGARATASAQPHAPGRATACATDPLRRLITTIVTGHASTFNRRQSPNSYSRKVAKGLGVDPFRTDP